MDTKAIIPIPDAPMVVGNRVTEVWFRFFLQLFNRTGGNPGGDLTKVIRDINDLQALLEGQTPADLSSEDIPPADVMASAAIALVMGRLDELQAQIQQVAGISAVPDQLPTEAATCCAATDAPPADVFTHGTHADETLHAVATPTSAGFMSAADKTKLDSL